jgi:uncharacterized protein (UPF0332 family)
VPNDKRKDLSAYRMGRAEDSIAAAGKLAADGLYLDSINRTYYAMFHAIRAVLALEGVDFKKHSAVISHFNKEYVKTGKFSAEISKYIMSAFEIRNESDYEDFFIASKTDAEKQLSHAKAVSEAVQEYILKKSKEH